MKFAAQTLRRIRPHRTLLPYALALCLAFPSSGVARVFFDVNDDALINGPNPVVIQALDNTIFTVGDSDRTVTLDSTDVRFYSDAAGGFFQEHFGQVPAVFVSLPSAVAGGVDGVQITFDPPVSAVGVQLSFVECRAQVTFTGSSGVEVYTHDDFTLPFIGAADIGDISMVQLKSVDFGDPDVFCAWAYWTEMRFVPSSGGGGNDIMADLSLGKTGPDLASQDDSPITYQFSVENVGPDDAPNTQVVDFLPSGGTYVSSDPDATLVNGGQIATMTFADPCPAGTGCEATLNMALPPFDFTGGPFFRCGMTMLNRALVTSSAVGDDSANNTAMQILRFDDASRFNVPESCTNYQDDDCDGRVDCADSECSNDPACTPPPLPVDNADCFLYLQLGMPCPFPDPPPQPMADEECTGYRNGVLVDMDPCCCHDSCSASKQAECGPIDPNFKTADPPTNVRGFGHTSAGAVHTYTITYKNVGNADAHDVKILDVLDDNLDDTTLALPTSPFGVTGDYDPANRVIEWTDPVLPPDEPRTVSFSVNVLADALPYTRIPNQATIIFPDAVPPSRVDTDLVEHTVVDPARPLMADLGVVDCIETGPGTGEFEVWLYNKGRDWGYNVTAELVGPAFLLPGVTDGDARFGRSDDFADTRTAIAQRTTASLDTVAFTPPSDFASCRAMTWRISYEEVPGGPVTTVDVRVDTDGDEDAVADAEDNCPADFNPDQADSDDNGIGDVCEKPGKPHKKKFRRHHKKSVHHHKKSVHHHEKSVHHYHFGKHRFSRFGYRDHDRKPNHFDKREKGDHTSGHEFD